MELAQLLAQGVAVDAEEAGGVAQVAAGQVQRQADVAPQDARRPAGARARGRPRVMPSSK